LEEIESLVVAESGLPYQSTPTRQATSGLDRGRARGDGSDQSLSAIGAPERPARGKPLPIGTTEIRSAPKRHWSKTFDPVVHLEPGPGQDHSSPRPPILTSPGGSPSRFRSLDLSPTLFVPMI